MLQLSRCLWVSLGSGLGVTCAAVSPWRHSKRNSSVKLGCDAANFSDVVTTKWKEVVGTERPDLSRLSWRIITWWVEELNGYIKFEIQTNRMQHIVSSKSQLFRFKYTWWEGLTRYINRLPRLSKAMFNREPGTSDGFRRLLPTGTVFVILCKFLLALSRYNMSWVSRVSWIHTSMICFAAGLLRVNDLESPALPYFTINSNSSAVCEISLIVATWIKSMRVALFPSIWSGLVGKSW